MKTRGILWLLAALLLVSALGGCGKRKVPPEEIKDITHFFFTYSNGNDFDARVFYQLDGEDGLYTAVVKPEGVKDENAWNIRVDGTFVERLTSILRENDVGSWNGFDKRDTRYHDGIGFSLYVTLADGTTIDAVGYMEWPQGYGSVEAGLDELFLGLEAELVPQ